MKIAVPVKDNNVDDHFGHCEFFRMVTIENNEIVSTEDLPSQQGCGCKSGIIPILKDMGVELMLIGNMGQGAYDKVTSAGIKVIRGCSGEVSQLISDYLAGKISDQVILCNEHGNDHACAN